ncbi:LIM domain [Geosmithia morbida]|uniref:LIM domain n=1 Tax=Geosmithia morbida TaxID=1094350 RepID=A0A9P4Z1I3_9HYPO|nr:LIM domain [Geosmithia morbida]KAF4125709.1 LIM domain [Geosmithia morbida]
MAMTRESAFLPTIKCSQCGAQVEISMMGEHICATGGDEQSSKSPRKLVPVDIDAANKPYAQQAPRTPMNLGSHNSPGGLFAEPAQGRSSELYSSSDNGSEGYVPSPLSARRSNGHGGLNESDTYTMEPLPSPGAGVLQRMDNITPGPFDHRRPSAAGSVSSGRPFASGSVSPSFANSLAPTSPYPEERPGTGYSMRSTGSGENMAPPRLPRKDGYEGFGPPLRSETELQPPARLVPLDRSETFPRASLSTEPPARTPSAPGTRSSDSRQSPRSMHGRQPSMGPDTSRKPPPRKSLIRPARGNPGSVDLAREFGVGNPYHTPSDSASSATSAFSGPSFASSQTSPSRTHSRQDVPDFLRQPRPKDNTPKPLDITPKPLDIPRQSTLRAGPMTSPRTPSPLADSPGELAVVDENTFSRSFGSSRSPTAAGEPLATSPQQPASNDRWGSPPDSLHMKPAPAPPVPKSTGDSNYRGDCKACGQPIKGKSVSSADGRLTGKYHKACFVCTTCAEPFTSAEFYVLDDRPYCEQHYHKLNGSLCGGCGRGIEGQFVADESSTKYHLSCFSCLDCGRSLTEGYFEVDGRAYCEQDALYRVNSAPPPAPMYNNSPPPGPYPYGGGGGGYGRPGPPPGPGPYGPPPRRPTGGGGPMPPRPMGLPSGPGPSSGSLRPRGPNPNGMPRPYPGPPGARRPGPGPGGPGMPHPSKGGFAPRPQMNKRSTRLGMM